MAPLNDDDVDLSVLFEGVSLKLGALGLLAIDFSDPGWTCNPGSEACGYNKPQTWTINATFTWVAPPPSECRNCCRLTPRRKPTFPNRPALFGLGLVAIGYQRRKFTA